MQTKKLEILEIDDIIKPVNKNLYKSTNDNIKFMLFNMRIIFRHNDENLDDLIDLYYTLDNLLNNKEVINFKELKNLINKINNTILNMDDENIKGILILLEPARNLTANLYDEIQKIKLKQQLKENPGYSQILKNQLLSPYDLALEIKDKKLLKSNFQLELIEIKSRKEL